MKVRRAKRERMLAEGRQPYPAGVPVTRTIAEVRAQHVGLEAGTETDDAAGVAGRVVFRRNTGKLCFATVKDGEGNRLQVMLSQAVVGPESLERFKTDVDLGDHLFAHGRIIGSRRGELSIFADRWQIAAKSLRPLPVLHKELSEEARVRQRYVDLVVRPAARDMVRLRAAVVRSPLSSSSSGRSPAGWRGSSRSTGTSATRVPTGPTRRSSQWSRRTRRTATTTRWPR